MELFNELPLSRAQSVEDFLAFIPIYESKLRHRALRTFLKKNRALIAGKVCLEAGAGRGLFSAELAALGASKVIAVERSEALFQALGHTLSSFPNIHKVKQDITRYRPAEKIDLLFHEFYGPLVLDEALPALRRLRFKPAHILPDGGRLWAMPISEKTIAECDKVYDPSWKKSLFGALVSDLFTGIPFSPRWKVFDWNVHSGATVFRFDLPQACEWIALCGEITHEGSSVLPLWKTGNWPVIFTPVAGKTFELKFRYTDGFTKVYFKWIESD